MTQSKAALKAKAKYNKTKTRTYCLRLNLNTDKDIIAFLDECGNKQGYIKEILRQSMIEQREKAEERRRYAFRKKY